VCFTEAPGTGATPQPALDNNNSDSVPLAIASGIDHRKDNNNDNSKSSKAKAVCGLKSRSKCKSKDNGKSIKTNIQGGCSRSECLCTVS
jgi:hypothetical protein